MKIKPVKIILRGMPQVDRAIEILRMLPLEPVMQVEIKVLKDIKSLAQLRTVHGWLREVQEVFQESQGKFYTIDSLKEHFKSLFGVTQILDMPDGTQRVILKSFANYEMEEMATMMEKMLHYCGSELHIYLTIPGDDF
jgi:hypothetical protein